MILYHVVSTYQLLNAIVHKLSINKDKEGVLIVSNWIAEKFPAYDDLDKFFTRVIVINAEMALCPDYHEKNTEYCERLLKDNGYSISDFSEIHAMGYHYNFGAYLSHNNIKHNFWEDAAGLLSAPEILININRRGFPKLAEFCEKEHLYDGTARGIDKRYCNYKAQKDGFEFNDTVNFDVTETYLSLDDETQAEVLAFFSNVKKMNTERDSVLILTQQFFSVQVMPFEDQALIYQIFVDYFIGNGNLIFKPHPDDYMFYGLLFPDSTVIREKFPAEFLPALFSNRPKTIATISSTAIANLKNYFDEAIVLGTRFETEFKFTHRYKIAYEIKNSLCHDHELITIGVNDKYNTLFGATESADASGKFYIVDKLAMQEKYSYDDIIDVIENSADDDVFVFINSDDDYPFYNIEHKAIWDNVLPIVIKKKQERADNFFSDTDEETFFVYTRNREVFAEISKFEYSHELRNTGLTISVDALSEDQYKIRLLEALLAATEHRLFEYEAFSKTKQKGNAVPIVEINGKNIIATRYSNKNVPIEEIDRVQNRMRILEGIIRSTEQRLISCSTNVETED